jgi:signal transduction histidine kinase
LIALIIFAGYGFYLLLDRDQPLMEVGLASIIAVAQFLPGVVGLLYWSRASSWGFVTGLVGGGVIGALGMVLPIVERSGLMSSGVVGTLLFLPGASNDEPWSATAFWSLTVNSVLFVAVSLVTRRAPDEVEAAHLCCRDALLPAGGLVAASSPVQFRERLGRLLGPQLADKETHRALDDLKMSPDEMRPVQLHRLRDAIESNLSGLIGPLLARMIVHDQLPTGQVVPARITDNMSLIEQRLEESDTRLRGLAAELDALRRYHRQVLRDLPLGVCTLGSSREVTIWNHAMEAYSGYDSQSAIGRPVRALPEPWATVLGDFSLARDPHVYLKELQIGDASRWFNFYKAAISHASLPRHRWSPQFGESMVILVEDITDLRMLEAKLTHSERLVSIGMLAAGVAHEIGNPVTAIACVAQNMRDEADPRLCLAHLDEILRQCDRIRDIVQSLVSFSHVGSASDRETVFSLCECLEEAVRLVKLGRAGKWLSYARQCPVELFLAGDRQRLLQVFVNVLTNAADASEPGKQVRVGAVREGAYVKIEFIDQGTGIPRELQERVFEPFFTTKRLGEGTGLGLSLSNNIVGEHGGHMRLRSTPGEGTCVTIWLPHNGHRASDTGVRQ